VPLAVDCVGESVWLVQPRSWREAMWTPVRFRRGGSVRAGCRVRSWRRRRTRSRVRWCLLERRRRMIVGINRPIRLTVWRPSASLAVLRVWMVESFDTADLVGQRGHGGEALAGGAMRGPPEVLRAGIRDVRTCV